MGKLGCNNIFFKILSEEKKFDMRVGEYASHINFPRINSKKLFCKIMCSF